MSPVFLGLMRANGYVALDGFVAAILLPSAVRGQAPVRFAVELCCALQRHAPGHGMSRTLQTMVVSKLSPHALIEPDHNAVVMQAM